MLREENSAPFVHILFFLLFILACYYWLSFPVTLFYSSSRKTILSFHLFLLSFLFCVCLIGLERKKIFLLFSENRFLFNFFVVTSNFSLLFVVVFSFPVPSFIYWRFLCNIFVGTFNLSFSCVAFPFIFTLIYSRFLLNFFVAIFNYSFFRSFSFPILSLIYSRFSCNLLVVTINPTLVFVDFLFPYFLLFTRLFLPLSQGWVRVAGKTHIVDRREFSFALFLC